MTATGAVLGSVAGRRSVARIAVVALLAGIVAAAPGLGPTPAASASPASSNAVNLEGWAAMGGPADEEAASALSAEDGSERGRPDAGAADEERWFVSDVVPAGDAFMGGLELSDGQQPEVEFRSRLEGEWSQWTPTGFPEDDDGPDPGSDEAEQARNATEPVWFGEADALQVRVLAGDVPDEARLHTVDVDGPLEFDPLDAGNGAAHADPGLISRRQWDPNNDCAPRRAASEASQAEFAVIHHTAGSNNYTSEQAASQVRGICLYHRNTLGWNDIGYNFLVDRYGRAYEGRAGGVERAIVGAHAANYNTGSVGVSVMGCFDSACASSLGSNALPWAALRTVDEIVAWKFALHGIDPHDRISYRNGHGTTVTLDTIVGHRDVGSTACPGSNFVPYVRGAHPMKDRVAPLMLQFAAPWQDGVAGSFVRPDRDDLVVFDPGDGKHTGARSTGSSFEEGTWATWATRSGWTAHVVGDFRGTGREGRASFHSGSGNWVVNHHDGTRFRHGVWASFRTTTNWNTHVTGDFTGNGRDDIASFHGTTGNWVVSASNGTEFATKVWSRFRTTSGWQSHLVGDFTGNGRDDILSYHPGTGNWMLQRSTGSGFRVERWNAFRTKTGWGAHVTGDFTGDGRADVASFHDETANLVVSRGAPGSVRTSVWARLPTGQHAWGHHFAGDLTGNGVDDVLSVNDATGALWGSRSTRSTFDDGIWARLEDPTEWAHHLLLDATGDGISDLASYREAQNSWWVSRSTGSSLQTERWR